MKSEVEKERERTADKALDGPMRAAILSVAIVGAALSVGGLLAYGVTAALSVFVGGAIATLNLFVLARLVKAFLDPEGNKGPWIALALFKLTLLFGGVWFLVKHDVVSIPGLAAGFTALPIGITLGTVMGPKPAEDAPARDKKSDRKN